MDQHALVQKTAVVFSKTGPAIYHSHHDMMRFWERALKRARLPMRMTQGFNPHPRLIFPHALGLGIASLHEEVELELHQAVARNELLARVKDAAGDTLGILDAIPLPPVKKSRQIVESSYLVTRWGGVAADRLAGAVREILALPEIPVERGAPGKRREVDIRPFIQALDVGEEQGEVVLSIVLRHNAGSARPDEIVEIAASGLGVAKPAVEIWKTSMILE